MAATAVRRVPWRQTQVFSGRLLLMFAGTGFKSGCVAAFATNYPVNFAISYTVAISGWQMSTIERVAKS
jgi:hypothetical protein